MSGPGRASARAFGLGIGAALLAAPVLAYDGWRLESSVTIEGPGSAWDYVKLDPAGARLYIGHRKEGLQVYDTASRKVIATVAGTAKASSNGATLAPEFDLGLSNNEDGTLTPFKLSTLEAGAPIRVAEELDSSFYDPATKRVLVNVAPGKDGVDLVVLQAPALTSAGVIHVRTRKPEHAAADGTGLVYLAARDVEAVYKIDMAAMKVVAEWPTPGCGQTNGLALDAARARIFVGCRGNDRTKPSLAVLDAQDGHVVYTAEIGGGNDGVVYDATRKRIFTANGVHAVLNVFEQIDADRYKPLEAVGTAAGVRGLAYDEAAGKLYSVTADGAADYGKKITTSVSPWYANTFVPNTFRVLVYSKP